MENLIGKTIEDAKDILHNLYPNKQVVVNMNDHKVEGDRVLVTNAVMCEDAVVLTVGKFIFDLKEMI